MPPHSIAGRFAAIAAPALAVIAPCGVSAQTACEATLPEGFASWRAPVAQAAAAGPEERAQAHLEVGRAVEGALRPAAQMRYLQKPGKVGGEASHGGLFTFDVAEAGTYRVALGAAAWVDVVGPGGTQASTAHAHGPECSGIRKMVDFALQPGRYTLQLSASAGERVTILVMQS